MSGAELADEAKVKRRSINVIKARLEDIVVGDVVNRKPDAEGGWFSVHAVTTLFNGDLQLADESEQQTVSGNHKDMVGLQLVEEVDVDENGVIVPAVPVAPVAAVPTPAVPVEAVPAPAAPVAPPAETPAAQVATPGLTVPGPTADPENEAAAAAMVATEMRGPVGAPPPDIDLGLVLSLLEALDVGEDDDADQVPLAANLPAHAVAAYGGGLPRKPSYRDPVVVPDDTVLPRRSRAA